ncbi:MAG: hypothetical protein F2954_05350 [Actinobacteria bacterium]|nr:hypothetical protein [Actinomycetota bacterium]
MKLRRSAALLLGLNLLVVGAPSALADSTPSPTPTPSASPLSDLEQYKIALEQYRIDMNLREQERKEIAKTFIVAIKLADSVAKSALRSAKNDKAKIVILEQQLHAKEEAMQVRDEAITAMGQAPVEPIKPVKPITAATASTKKGKTSKPSPTPSS